MGMGLRGLRLRVLGRGLGGLVLSGEFSPHFSRLGEDKIADFILFMI
jgi:hypothetical protein